MIAFQILADIKGSLPLAVPDVPAEAPAEAPVAETVEIIVEEPEAPVRVVPPAEETLPDQGAVADVWAAESKTQFLILLHLMLVRKVSDGAPSAGPPHTE